MDRPEASTVTGRHVGVESLDGIGSGQLTVLLVHVVRARAGVVADPDTEVLDLQGVLLRDLPNCKFTDPTQSEDWCTYNVDGDDLASGLLDLAETAEEVPVTGLSDDLVRGEDPHAVEAGSRVRLRGQMAPNDLVFLQTT